MRGVVGVAMLAVGVRAWAVSPARQCHAACASRNLAVSCRWLAARPARCIAAGLRDCRRVVRSGAAAVCAAPSDLPACLSNHACPFGALCADGACQVVACGDDGVGCAGHQTCQGDHCVVADCEASSENCPSGLHCEPAAPPFESISGSCAADDPARRYCTTGADCITPGEPGLVCVRGDCVRRRPRTPGGGRTTTTKSSTTTTTTSTTTTTLFPPCAEVFDCPAGGSACCSGHCVPDPYAGLGICSTIYTPSCTLCHTDDDCQCDGIFCDTCEGDASLSDCVDPCG